MGWSVTNFVSRQSDTLVIGKLLGASPLGLYNIASRIMMLPVYIVGGALQSAIYPRLTRLRHDAPALRQVILAATLAQAALVFPPIAAVAAASEAFFKLLLSDRWLAAGPLFTLLAVASAVQTITAINASLLQAIGRTGARLRLTVEFAILWAVTSLALGLVSIHAVELNLLKGPADRFDLGLFGVHAVALGCSVVNLLYLPRLVHLYVGPIGCSIRDFLRVLIGPAAVAIAIFATHRFILSRFEMDSWPQIGLAALETLAGYGLLLWFGRRTLMQQVQAVRAIVAKEPPEPSPPRSAEAPQPS
jgi:PST family polysaccharide transporter